MVALRRRRGSGAADHPRPRRTAKRLSAGGGGGGLPMLRQSPRPVVAACRRRGMGLWRDGQRGLARPAAEGRARQGRCEGGCAGGVAGRRRWPGAADDAGLPEELADGQGDGRRGDHRHVDEWPAAAASEWLSRARDRAGLDRDLLDEARHQHPAQQQAARQLLDARRPIACRRGCSPVDHPFPSQDNADKLADHRDGGELGGRRSHRRNASDRRRLRRSKAWRGIAATASGRWRSRWTAARAGSRRRWARTSGGSRSAASASTPERSQPATTCLSSRAINNAGETQVDKLKFNPAGYHNNVPQQIRSRWHREASMFRSSDRRAAACRPGRSGGRAGGVEARTRSRCRARLRAPPAIRWTTSG